MTWEEVAIDCFKDQQIETITYVPDIILAELIKRTEHDPCFNVISATREEEAIAILCGAYLGGRRGAILMQNSGLGNSVNVLASLIIPYQVSFLMLISQRGQLGEFNTAQVGMGQALEPVLDGLGIQHFVLDREDHVGPVLRGACKLAFSTDRPVAVILSTLLTGGKQA